jgi:hypothetical protein
LSDRRRQSHIPPRRSPDRADQPDCAAAHLAPACVAGDLAGRRHHLAWDAEWPPLEEGRYVWNLGYGGSAIFRVVALDDNVDNPLDAAGVYLRNDCGAQAKAAFEQVIANAAQE